MRYIMIINNYYNKLGKTLFIVITHQQSYVGQIAIRYFRYL